MKYLFTFLLFLIYLLPAQSQTNKKRLVYSEELESLYRIDLLPTYRDNCLVEQVSSYDRTGGNDDGFNGTYSFVGKENGKLILADLKGPGIINRIWTPTPTNDTIEFYFDGEKKARLRICFNDLFSGKVYPFIAPLCGNEIGGFYCYLPIPYQKSCKIMFTGDLMKFYQIQYRNLPGYQVNTFTGILNQEEKDILNKIKKQWSNTTSSPANVNYQTSEASFVLEPGTEYTFFSKQRGGRIVGFEIDDNSYFEGQYKDIIISATWDDDKIPAIYAPASDFFGYAFGKSSMRSLLIGKNKEINYSYLPCPFDNNAEMKLIYRKRSDVDQPSVLVKTKVYYTDSKRDKGKEGKLYTSWRREIDPPKGKYYNFLSTKGKGHYVGTIHQTQGLLPEMTVYFEGDDSTHVDGKMRIHGTGSEDYYNGGWYALPDRWDTGVSLPIHGSLGYLIAHSQTGGYRFYLTDKLSFEHEFYMGIERGPTGNEYPVDYTSVAFYYADRPPTTTMYPDDRLRKINPPDQFRFYPQMMKFTVFHGTDINYRRSISISAEHEGAVKIFLEDIPEGKYKIYLSYIEKSDNGYFAVWQRQNLIKDWTNAYNVEERFKEREYIGQTYFTKQTSSLTIKVRNNKEKNKFEFDCLYLEKVNE